MSKEAAPFPAVDLSPVGMEDLNGYKPELLHPGFNARAWKVGQEVVKLSKKPSAHENAEYLLCRMKLEHELLEEFLGGHMLDTTYGLVPLADDEDKVHVAAVQPFIVGESLADFLGRSNSNTEALQDFLDKCMGVYRARKLMPDIANIQQGFSVVRNSNVVIDVFSEDSKPVLVDTNFGKIQRSKSLGPLWTRAIYDGARRTQRKLRKRKHV